MKKIILIFVILLLTHNVSAIEEYKNVGIAKYAVLEVTQDNVPLRKNDNEKAQRITHLFQGVILFADKESENYFRVELEDNKYAYINKKYVEVQAIIPEKRFADVEKITFKEQKNKYIIKIQTPQPSSFIIENKDNNLDFTLYDVHFDPTDFDTNKINDNFLLSDKIENKLNIKYINTKPLFGYWAKKTDKGIDFIVKKTPKINKLKPLKNITITVDPGHGGSESGACAFGLYEKDINLQISKKLKKELKKGGAKVYLTRTKDKAVNLYDRPLFAEEKNSDILISIHQNSTPLPKYSGTKHGVGTYYYHDQSYPLALNIQKSLLASTGFKDDYVNKRAFALVRPTAQISVLVECGYIIHQEEAKKISDKKFQKIIAKAIAQGTKNYLKETF